MSIFDQIGNALLVLTVALVVVAFAMARHKRPR